MSYFGGKIAVWPVETGPPSKVNTAVFALEESASHFQRDKHKELVAVYWERRPSMGTTGFVGDKDEKAVVERLNRFFFKLGYKRVLILGRLSSGIRVISDSDVVADTPATAPSEEGGALSRADNSKPEAAWGT